MESRSVVARVGMVGRWIGERGRWVLAFLNVAVLTMGVVRICTCDKLRGHTHTHIHMRAEV